MKKIKLLTVLFMVTLGILSCSKEEENVTLDSVEQLVTKVSQNSNYVEYTAFSVTMQYLYYNALSKIDNEDEKERRTDELFRVLKDFPESMDKLANLLEVDKNDFRNFVSDSEIWFQEIQKTNEYSELKLIDQGLLTQSMANNEKFANLVTASSQNQIEQLVPVVAKGQSCLGAYAGCFLKGAGSAWSGFQTCEAFFAAPQFLVGCGLGIAVWKTYGFSKCISKAASNQCDAAN